MRGFGVKKERNYFIENLSMLTQSGMVISDAIDGLREEVRSKKMKRILGEVHQDIENGSPLWKALRKSGLMSSHTLSLIRVGEESGKLSQNLKVVSEQEDRNRAFKSRIRSAMIYPLFLFILTITVAVVVVWFILPRLSNVFSQLDVELPALTKWLIALGDFLGKYGGILIPSVLITLFLIIYFVFFFPKTKGLGQMLLFAVPGVGKLLRHIELARFSYVMGTLLKAGVPIIDALNSLKEATNSPIHKKFYAYLSTNISEGISFQKAFAQNKKTRKVIPPTIQRLVISGEKSGKLSDTLIKTSNHLETKIEDTTKNLSVIFEPILLIIVWIGVVMVALSVILPVYSLIGGAN